VAAGLPCASAATGEPFDALRLLRAFDSLFPSRSSFRTLFGESRPAMSERSESNGGGGNCTRSPGSAIICPQCGYDMVTEARPEMGREGAALHELVANWHGLTSSVRAKIVDLLRSG
jgi:hypothetical protein